MFGSACTWSVNMTNASCDNQMWKSLYQLIASWCPNKEITWYKQQYMCAMLVHTCCMSWILDMGQLPQKARKLTSVMNKQFKTFTVVNLALWGLGWLSIFQVINPFIHQKGHVVYLLYATLTDFKGSFYFHLILPMKYIKLKVLMSTLWNIYFT